MTTQETAAIYVKLVVTSEGELPTPTEMNIMLGDISWSDWLSDEDPMGKNDYSVTKVDVLGTDCDGVVRPGSADMGQDEGASVKFVQILVLADGSYGPVEGAQIIAIPEEMNNAEDIEECIDGIRMFDYPSSDDSEGFLVMQLSVGY